MSTDKAHGRSVEEQDAENRAVCEREGWRIVQRFTDNDRGASRFSNGDRPDYRRLVEFVRAGRADVLVTWEASRAQRDLAVYVKLRDLCRENGVLWCYSGRVYDLARTDDAFTTGLDALLAEREASVTRDRVLRAVRANAAKGRPHGKLLYGYAREYDERTGHLLRQVVRDDQAAVVREAARRVLAGEALYAVARDFNARGILAPRAGDLFTRTRNGKQIKVPASDKWDPIQVKRLLRNPAYIGKRVHLGKVVGDADWAPVLDEETFYTLTAKLADPRRRSQRDGAIRHLLSGIAVCGHRSEPEGQPCSAPLRVLKNRGYPSYGCSAGFHTSIRETKLDDFVIAVVIERLSRPDVLELLAGPDDRDEAREAAGEAAEKRVRLDGFYDAAAAGELTPAALARIEARLLPEIEAADKRAREVRVAPILRKFARPDIADLWATLTILQQREIITALMEVRLLPTGRGRRTFDPARVEISWKTL